MRCDLDLKAGMLHREFHYVAFHANWQRFANGTFPGFACKPGLMYHSIAMINLGKNRYLSHFCRVNFLNIAEDSTKAHPYICKLLDILPQVIAPRPVWLLQGTEQS